MTAISEYMNETVVRYRFEGKGDGHGWRYRLQALVYDILPPTTAIVDYAIGLEKLPASEQFFDDAQTAVSL